MRPPALPNRDVVRIVRRLDLLILLSLHVIHMEVHEMAIGQDILDQIAAEDTAIDSLIALIQGLQTAGTIDAVTATAILAAVSGDRTKLEAALAANVPPAPTP